MTYDRAADQCIQGDGVHVYNSGVFSVSNMTDAGIVLGGSFGGSVKASSWLDMDMFMCRQIYVACIFVIAASFMNVCVSAEQFTQVIHGDLLS